MWRVAAKVGALQQVVLLHVAQPADERSTTDGIQTVEQLHRSLWAGDEFSDDEHGPSVTEHLQGSGYRTTI